MLPSIPLSALLAIFVAALAVAWTIPRALR